jgi:hypothetical protein
MLHFEEEFRRSKGQSIQHKGKTLVMWDQFPVPEGLIRLQLRFVSTNSNWKQGVSLTVDGYFLINERRVNNAVILWEDTAPRVSEFECETRNGYVEVVNAWDTGDGVRQSWHAGAAIIIEEIKEGRRYLCNDGHLDDDFDDLIFELRLVSE